MEARKNDVGKLRFDLFPVKPLEKVAEVFTIGAAKYEDRNWEKGIKWGRVFSAMMRHGWKWWSGEKRDQQDGQHHLASVAWCALVLMEYEETHPELDDRGGKSVSAGPYTPSSLLGKLSKLGDPQAYYKVPSASDRAALEGCRDSLTYTVQ